MEIESAVSQKPIAWKDHRNRKPLILQGLIQQFEGTPYYWRSGNSAEVNFPVQHQNSIVPIEVKSDENIIKNTVRKRDMRYKM